jgi:AraC-like DNA-binding protein
MGQRERAPVTRDLKRPTLPTTYPRLWLAMLERRGVSVDSVLEGTGLTRKDLEQEGARISPLNAALMTSRGLGLTGDPTLAYAFGLEMKPTAHGFLGYAAMTCPTLGDAIRLAERYLRLRVEDAVRLHLSVSGETASVAIENEIPNPFIRQFSMEVVTAAMVRAAELLLGDRPELEIYSEYPEPPHYAQVRALLPPIQFDMPRTEVRFSRALLERPLSMADPLASREATARLEQELAALERGADADLVDKVRGVLASTQSAFPDLPSCAKRLGVSERSLKRKLQQRGTSYQKLVDAERLARAAKLLQGTEISIERLASDLGYSDPTNFARAFRRWTGQSPRAFRSARRS